MHARFRVSGSRLDSIPFNSIRFELFKYSSEYLYSCCRIFRVGAGEGRGRECPFREDFKNYYSSGRGRLCPGQPSGNVPLPAPRTPKPCCLCPPNGAPPLALRLIHSLEAKIYQLIAWIYARKWGENIDPGRWKNILHVCGSRLCSWQSAAVRRRGCT